MAEKDCCKEMLANQEKILKKLDAIAKDLKKLSTHSGVPVSPPTEKEYF